MSKKYELAQSFNNGKAKNFTSIDTDATTLEEIIALMPDGQTVFAPTATGASGTARVRPTSNYVEAKAVCFDRSGDSFKSSFINIKLGKATLTDDDIVDTLKLNVSVPGGSLADNVSLKSFKIIGA